MERQLYLLGNQLSFGEFPALAPAGRNLVPGTLHATLPRDEAFRRAAEAHPGLRAPPPEGGALRECLRRHGLVPAWADLPALVPDLAPNAATAEMIKDGELAALAALKAEFPHASYRVRGRRGRPGVIVWDPALVADPAAVLARLLSAEVKVEVRREPPPATADPAPVSSATILVGPDPRPPFPPPSCSRCGDAVPAGRVLCLACEWPVGVRVNLAEVGWRTIARPELSIAA
jgi:hypothetical protein